MVLHEMGAHLEMCRQIQHEMLQRRVLQKFRFRKRRLAPRTILPTPERPMKVQHYVTEYVTKQEQTQEVVPEKLQIRGIYKTYFLPSVTSYRHSNT